MKASRLFLALAFCLLVSYSYAIRIPRVNSKPLEIQVFNDGDKISIDGGVKAIIASKDNEDSSSSSSSSGKFRKLMISPISSPSTVPTTISSKSLVAEEPSSGERKPESFESEAMPASSQEMEYGDITEMDYSPAKRKPPIHN